MKPARDLATIDAAIARSTFSGPDLQKRIAQDRRRRRRIAPTPASNLLRLGRALTRLRVDRAMRHADRVHAAWWNANDLSQRDGLERWDGFTAALWAESKGERYRIDCAIRQELAIKYRSAAESQGRAELEHRADKLERAGRDGFWGIREKASNPRDRVVVRLRDRSGLIKDDPAESRERTAELIERLMPALLLHAKQGYEIYSAVFTVPNVPAGSLAWVKEHIFREFNRLILERDRKGQEIPRTFPVRFNGKVFDVDNPARKFPEIVAAFAVQEDPLAWDNYSWNVHINVILAVDPGLCSPLDRELWPRDPDTGETKADPAADVDGMFSFMKLRHVWGHQLEIRRLEPSLGQLRAACLEVIKYSCKTVSEKSLEKYKAAAVDPPAAAPPAPVLEFDGSPAPEEGERPRAPPMTAWPDARIVEWIDANQGFRRVRSWGTLYRLGKIPRATDVDQGIRWMGRLWVSPYKVTAQVDFIDSLSSRSFVDWIRENKSPLSVPLPRGQGPPRAGSMPAP